MKVPQQEKKAEAIRRMKKWGLFPEVIAQFERHDRVNESTPPFGACFWVRPQQLERIREFEQKHNGLVYHVIHSYTDIGEMESYLYVNDYPEEWDIDNADIADGCQLAYVYNVSEPDLSELGSIGVKLSPAAGLQRTW